MKRVVRKYFNQWGLFFRHVPSNNFNNLKSFVMRKNIILLFIFSLVLVSCEEWLEEIPKTNKPLAAQTANDAQAAINGIYPYLNWPYNRGGFANMPYSILELNTGQYRNNAIDDSGAADIYNLNFSSTNYHFETWWRSCYNGIEAANIAIESIPGITDGELTDNLRSRLMGEAYFLRAYNYFMLVRMFGEIPLNVTQTTSEADGQMSKSPIKDVYEQVIVPDLLLAEQQSLPDVSTSGRVSMGAVKSLLAKVYLTMAGNPLQQQDKYAMAKDKAGEVITNGWYSLFQSDGTTTWFDKLNNSEYDNLEENIFMVQYNASEVRNSLSAWFLPQGNEDLATGLKFAGLLVNDWFYNSYDANDLRGQNRGFFFNEYEGLTFDLGVYKYFDKTVRETGPYSDKNVPLLRYSDILLTYAEAQNKADGSPNTQAYQAINSVRERAGLDPLNGLSQQAFEEAVWRERAWELTAEGKAWFDMKRTGKAFNGTGFDNYIGYTMPNGKTIGEQHVYFNIPQYDIDANPKLAN